MRAKSSIALALLLASSVALPSTADAQASGGSRLRFPAQVVVPPPLRAAIGRVYELCARGDLARLSNLQGLFSPTLIRKLVARHRAVAAGSQNEPVDPMMSCGSESDGQPWRNIARPNIRFEGGRPRASRAHTHLFSGNDSLIIDFILSRSGRTWVVTDLLFPDGGMFVAGRPSED